LSNAEERKLLAKMTELTDISRVWEMGVRLDVFEDPVNRFAFQFMVDYWLDSQMRHAPTWVVMETEFPQLQLNTFVEETTDWLIGRLKKRYATNRLQDVMRRAMDRSADEDPVAALDTLWHEAYDASQVNAPRYARVDITETIEARRERYSRDVRNQALAGVPIGLDELDQHTRGILPGELCAAAAYTKTGKSWLLAQAFVHALRTGRRPLFFTLEMGIPEMEDRIDALHSGVSYQRLSQRELNPDEVIALRASQDQMAEMRGTEGWAGFIERPQRGERTVKHMVSRARQVGANFLIIDQLSFIDAQQNYSGDSALRMKHGDLIFELKDEIARESVGKLPCLLAVQLNRQAAAGGNGGRGELYNFANSSMVEQTVDMALGLWRNGEMRANNAMGLDIMGSRRCDTRSWTLAWHLTDRSEIRIREEYIDNGGQQ
jgi:replicative DNA helicase